MESKSIGKNLNEIEIYSVIVLIEGFSVPGSHVTLDRYSAIMKAYDIYYKYRDTKNVATIFIDTWKNDVLVKSEYIDEERNLVIFYENHAYREKFD